MAHFVVTHGTFKVGEKWLGAGETIELSEVEAAKHLGCLKPKAQYELELQAEKAKESVLKGGGKGKP